MMQPPPWWTTSPPTPRAANDHGRQTQQPPPDSQRNTQNNALQHQGGPAFKAGMLPPSQQPKPPPLFQALAPANGQGTEHFTVKGRPEQRFHPFASRFGGALRDEMLRIYDADNDPEKGGSKGGLSPGDARRPKGVRPVEPVRQLEHDRQMRDRGLAHDRLRTGAEISRLVVQQDLPDPKEDEAESAIETELRAFFPEAGG